MGVRLSKMQTLPDEALPVLQWAYDAAKAERITQVQLGETVNAKLAELGLGPVSKSGLNRFVLKVRQGEIRRPQAIGSV